MKHQSEAELENNLIRQLVGLGYSLVKVRDEESLVGNLKSQLEQFNEDTYTDKEFDTILNHLSKGNEFDKAKTLRDRFSFIREDGEPCYVQFYDSQEWTKNLFQVTNQVAQEGSFLNRYDVTLLVNGLPLVQIELKRRGIEIKEAFNQINRYQKHSFWSNHGLFQYVQLFVISNNDYTKYLANNKSQSVLQTFFWADTTNKNILKLADFANAFLNPDHLGKFIAKYIVFNETYKVSMALRPYQYYAVEAIVNQVQKGNDNGYIWHTTGSGKTLTSFKASQIVMDLPNVAKVVFVVDRKDLDYQTMEEFNSFKKDSVDVTDNTSSLVKQLTDDSKLVLTTIQKLNNAITKRHYEKKLDKLKDKKVVFIFDECHRSQFGDTHKRITEYFQNNQLFGFTGTPIFAKNASKNALGKRTTKDLFGERLHSYVITDAIRDENVLKFGIEYIGKYKKKGTSFIDIEVEDIDKKEVLEDESRLEKIVDYIIAYHGNKTSNREYSALFAVSNIDVLNKYYDIFKRKKLAGEHDLKIAAIYSYGANEDDPDANDGISDFDQESNQEAATTGADLSIAAERKANYASKHSRDKLESILEDYNAMYNTAHSTKDSKLFEGYFKELSKRLKEREKANSEFNTPAGRLDIVLVVNMMLTGFDAKKVNTLYVDKNLKYHGLIQAYSRTNRILGEKKSQGNILAFRNLKEATDEAITLFSDKKAVEEVILPDYDKVIEKLNDSLEYLNKVAPTLEAIDHLPSEDEEAAFVQAFRRVMRQMNVLQSFTDFDWEDTGIDEELYEEYKIKYVNIHAKVKRQKGTINKDSILNDIDFEVELIHRDQINVAYIIKLLAAVVTTTAHGAEEQKKRILDYISGEVSLRSKRELIEKFINENLPNIKNADDIPDEFEQYWQDQKVLALSRLCEEENLDPEQFKSLIDTYIYSGQEPIKDDVLRCLANRPSILQARSIGERILNRMKEFVEVFVQGMVG